jgi:putative spermidine/putrescine transport system permease protein
VLVLLLAPPLLWLGVIYLGSLFALLIQGLFPPGGFSGESAGGLTFDNYAALLAPENVDIVGRTAAMAAAVTLAAVPLAFPLAYYMVRYASRRGRAILYLGVVLPLWSSYVIRVYVWRLILAKEGVINWVVTQAGLEGALEWLLDVPGIGGTSLSGSPIGMFLVFLYVWLPYMILPIQTALERVPRSLLDASSDLGARPAQTFRRVILPLAFPGVVAGSIFTFSLTLGDFIIPQALGNSSLFIGQVVLRHQGTAGTFPLAAAFTVVPMAIMAIYLTIAKKLGAFDAI